MTVRDDTTGHDSPLSVTGGGAADPATLSRLIVDNESAALPSGGGYIEWTYVDELVGDGLALAEAFPGGTDTAVAAQEEGIYAVTLVATVTMAGSPAAATVLRLDANTAAYGIGDGLRVDVPEGEERRVSMAFVTFLAVGDTVTATATNVAGVSAPTSGYVELHVQRLA